MGLVVRVLRAVLTVAAAAVATICSIVGLAAPASAGGGCHEDHQTDLRTTLVEIKQLCFAPTIARVNVGDTVVFRNTDPVTHTFTGLGGAIGGFDSIQTGGEIVAHFDLP